MTPRALLVRTQSVAAAFAFGVGDPKVRGGAPLNSLQRGGDEVPGDRCTRRDLLTKAKATAKPETKPET